MQQSTLRILVLVGVSIVVLLTLAHLPTTTYSQGVKTPTATPTQTPIPVGGHLIPVDRGAVLQASLGSWIMPAAAFAIFAGLVGCVVVRRRRSTS